MFSKYKKLESNHFPNSLEKLYPGDVLLCLGSGKLSDEMHKATNSSYNHVAIYLGSGMTAESVLISGVTKTPLRKLLKRYKHCVVLRRPEAWTQDRVKTMEIFVQDLIDLGEKYNLIGALEVGKQRCTDTKTLNLINSAQGHAKNLGQNDGGFFCSQLVASLFLLTGFIDYTAEFLFKADNTLPIKLAEDRAYGDFLGYIWEGICYSPPTSDELYHHLI
jgi:hypothetical protein